VIVAIISIQLGAAIAKTLFPLIGSQGTTALRLAFSSVLMLVVLMVTLTDDLLMSLSSNRIEPLKSVNRPWTVLTTIWLTAKPTREWTGSILYSSAANAVAPSSARPRSSPEILRIEILSFANEM